jgi:hypothetical protein
MTNSTIPCIPPNEHTVGKANLLFWALEQEPITSQETNAASWTSYRIHHICGATKATPTALM